MKKHPGGPGRYSGTLGMGESGCGIFYFMKSRNTSHFTKMSEFQISDCGVEILDVYFWPEGGLTGSARASLETREKAEAEERQGG